MIVEKHIRVLCGPQWATGARSSFRASVGGIWHALLDPEDPQRQSARTRADQLELPPPNVGVRRSDTADGLCHAGSQPTRPQTLIDQISALKHMH